MITLEDLLEVVNENTSIKLFNSNSYNYDFLGLWEYNRDIPEIYLECDVTDVYAYNIDTIAIDIDYESEV